MGSDTELQFHYGGDAEMVRPVYELREQTRTHFDFQNFFHPYTGRLLERLNGGDLADLFDPATQRLQEDFFDRHYRIPRETLRDVDIERHPKTVDVELGGAYANYNWELFFHIPLTIAVAMSKRQRFEEAQRWFHLIFDPTSTDTATPAPDRYWRFVRLQRRGENDGVAALLALLSTPADELDAAARERRRLLLAGYEAIRRHPFQPHAVARTRPLAYRLQVVMKYLDNLIAWGDSLFLQDTQESLNEATQRYVLAANLLGPRPQRLPSPGTVEPQTFAQLERRLDETGNALVELEGRLPFNLAGPTRGASAATAGLFGIGRTLYFAVPGNQQLLRYWDTVADRLYKLRHGQNIEGLARMLALFDAPLDPGMLTRAAAAGLDVAGIVAGTTQPASPLRALPLIRRALELCADVRNLGTALLGAFERGDAEHLVLLRQEHELRIQRLAREQRFLQVKQAEAATDALLHSRTAAVERHAFYVRLQGLTPAAPQAVELDRNELNAADFDAAYRALVERYAAPLTRAAYTDLRQELSDSSLVLSARERSELAGLRTAADVRYNAALGETLAGLLSLIPEFKIVGTPMGVGSSATVTSGAKIADALRAGLAYLKGIGDHVGESAAISGRVGAYERRRDEWILQGNLAATELEQIGRQILSALLAEHVARQERKQLEEQIRGSEEVGHQLETQFTGEELYTWMQSELSRLYYEWYRFAFDTARKAERALKLELRQPELDATQFVRFNYWDGGRKGLLAGEGLALDVKRMETAYLESRARELELTRHVSLRQLDPLALLRLRTLGSCTVTIPEALYDRDYPGHYMRRIRQVALSIPSVTGPYTPIPCTLTLLHSTIRVSPLLASTEYKRAEGQDDRFVDLYGPVESIATSTAVNDAGLFDPNATGEEYGPFENAGAISTWQLELPADLRGFDYASISDVILHVRYTARPAGGEFKRRATAALRSALESNRGAALLLSLKHDFPSGWAAFRAGTGDVEVMLEKRLFPYLVQDQRLRIGGMTLYAGRERLSERTVTVPPSLANDLNAGVAELRMSPDERVLRRDAVDVLLVIDYGISAA